ncbi:MAG: thioredoxin [Thermoanaerobaculia bacterium]|nr:thioredoxin [Thermoanaerobaculia bacterium]
MKDLSEADFEDAVAAGPVLIDFSAEWCGPCKALTPVIERVSKDYDGRLSVYKVDVDHAQAVAARNGVMSVPTLVMFRDGRPVDRKIGAIRESDLREMIENHLE